MPTIKWASDPAHSEILFKVKHLMITTVTGYFKIFKVLVETETDDFNTTSDVLFTAAIDSIETNNTDRNAHLKSADFFDAEKYPVLKFVTKKYEGNGAEAKLHGDLTIRDTTRPVVINVEFGGIAVDPYGQTKAGFTINTKISRKEYGLTYSAVTEAGGIVVGDEIIIQGELQLIKQ
ncbi:YceI family protein [soil metagenome]